MLRQARLVLLTATALVAAQPVLAQSFSGLLPSADVPVAPRYPVAVPNNGQPLADIRAITGFDRTFGYGSSSTNTRRADRNIDQNTPGNTAVFTEVNTNGHANYIELLSPLVGAANGRGSSFPPATNFADGGSNSVTALTGSATLRPQVADFQRFYGRYSPGDIVVQWSGINDWNVSNIRTQAQVDQIRNTNVAFQTEMVRQNLALGARNYVFIGLSDLGTFRNFTQASRNNDAGLLTQGSLGTNAGMLPNLVALQRQTGANILYFDQDLFVRQIRANPTAYGFAPNGAAPNVDCIQAFGGATQCASRPFNEQNRYMSLDGLHWTYRFHSIQAQAIANQLLAPYTVAPQAEVGEVVGRSFSNSLFSRLDAHRYQNGTGTVQAGYAADLPGRTMAPQPVAVALGSPLSIFGYGTYAGGERDARRGSFGFDYDVGAGTIGAEYRINPHALVGAAFNYSSTDSRLTSLGGANIRAESYQGAAFASLSYPNLFVDGVVTYGANRYDLSRPGLVDLLQASPHGDTLTAGARGGYLFDIGDVPIGPLAFNNVKLGPVAGLVYTNVGIDRYSERGDPLLAIGVRGQELEGLTGSAGLQLRYSSALFGLRLNSFLNVTAEHEFLDGARTLTTFQTYAPDLPISTVAGRNRGDTYGKVARGFSLDLSPTVSALVTASSTFGRSNGEDYAVNAGLRIRF